MLPRCVAVAILSMLLLHPCFGADTDLVLATAQGTIEKADKDSVTIRPRGPDGKFGKNLVLKLTGTSKITTLSPQTRAGKVVMTQRETDAKDLQPKQLVAVIYAQASADAVLLAAVVQPAADK